MGEEYNKSLLSDYLIGFYRLSNRRSLRKLIRNIAIRSEGGGLYSHTIRKIFKTFHDIEIGYYTNGPCHSAEHYPYGTKIGRYCSIMESMRIFAGNHPLNTKSTHALFFNPALGNVGKDMITRTTLEISDDVWIGHNAILLSGTSKIGRGAVIGAGAVVNNDVAPYAVVVGNPARVVRYRFSDEIIAKLEHERWWEKSIHENNQQLESFRIALDGNTVR